LPIDSHVLDIACGKGEFLIRLVKTYGVRGLGIDISPFYIAEAKRRLEARAPSAGIVFRKMNGADYRPDESHSFDLVSCIGASWVFGGHTGTIDALISMVRPGGWVIVGEPFWLQEPSEAYLDASGDAREAFGSHFSNAQAGEERGLDLVHAIVSSKDDWDKYEGMQWYAMVEYARAHPDDPDLPKVIERVGKAREVYLRWGRDTLGWAIYLFRQRPAEFPSGRPLD
ncbi:MAG: class I SAM-dependent methyltransferase, partial [Bacteroidetes bacterium]|nr:class I SAM-dependent methyltransferase [Bacteroidota bacterium]